MTQNCGVKAQGVLRGEGGVGEGASGAVRPPYTNAYAYILTRPSLETRKRLHFGAAANLPAPQIPEGVLVLP